MPELTRRNFLAALGVGAGALGAAPQQSPALDTRVELAQWLGWRWIPNQLVYVGLWAVQAPPDAQGRTHLIATTHGHVGRYHDMEVIDMSRRPDWPVVTWRTSEAERDALKQRARALLADHAHV